MIVDGMVLKDLRKWISMATSSGVANEMDEKKHRERNMPVMYRRSGC